MDHSQPEPEKAFLGRGWAYPLQLAADETLAMSAYEEDIRQAIRIILGTNRGERVMRPDFGTGLQDFVYEPLNTTTMRLVQNRVQEALTEWEPRIDVIGIDVKNDKTDREKCKLMININYQVRATNAHHNLVYPFYLQEGTVR